MEKTRVTAMRITKRGQTAVPEETPRELSRESPRRETLRARMSEVGRKQRERTKQAVRAVRKREEDARRGRRPGAETPERRTARRMADTPPSRSWRPRFLAQTGVCAAVLASVLLFRWIDTPLTHDITDGLSDIVTMEVDVGRDIGRLRFVRGIVPESVLTFWESVAETPQTFAAPFKGAVAVGYSSDHPGVIYTGEDDGVLSAADGTVDSVRTSVDGGYAVKIRHDGGVDTVYGLLTGVKVAPGDKVSVGENIGLALRGNAGYHLYFQALRAGKAFDPAELFAP